MVLNNNCFHKIGLFLCYHLMVQNDASSDFNIYIVDMLGDMQRMFFLLSIHILLKTNDSFDMIYEVAQMLRFIIFSFNVLVSITLRCICCTNTTYEYHTVQAKKQCFSNVIII